MRVGSALLNLVNQRLVATQRAFLCTPNSFSVVFSWSFLPESCVFALGQFGAHQLGISLLSVGLTLGAEASGLAMQQIQATESHSRQQPWQLLRP
jgi:hypothetical protein